jgi:hypothetical protein
MDDPLPPELNSEPQNLRFLRILVTVLTATMILGIATIVVLLFIRFSGETPAQSAVTLPDQIELPDGVAARAVTFGDGWYAVVTDGNNILIFDQATGELRQSVEIR